jgi:hypothetical protein
MSYTWYSGDIGHIINITFPDGIYEVADLNLYLQNIMIQNGTYWAPGPGGTQTANRFFIELQVNPVRYGVQLNTFQVPNTDPELSGYVYPPSPLTADYVPLLPPGAAFNPSVAWQTGVIVDREGNPLPGIIEYPVVPGNILGVDYTLSIDSKFGGILGYGSTFVSDTFVPPSAVNSTQYQAKYDAENTISYLSNGSPNLQPNGSVVVCLSQAQNVYSQPSSVIYAFPNNVAAGETITSVPPNFMWTPLIKGSYYQLNLQLRSSATGNLLDIRDPNMTIVLAIEDTNELNPPSDKNIPIRSRL